jgi:hypothetical protein
MKLLASLLARSLLPIGVVGLFATLARAAAELPLALANPGFEALTDTNRTHFDELGLLLRDHYSAVPDFVVDLNGFNTNTPIPGWVVTGAAGTINYSDAFSLNGNPVTEGLNGAWIQNSGALTQTTGLRYLGGSTYRLTADLASRVGTNFPGAVVRLLSGQQVVAQTPLAALAAPGVFQPLTTQISLPLDSRYAGHPISVQIGIPDPAQGQVIFDRVRLTAQADFDGLVCLPAPDGLIGWWRAGGNLVDAAGSQDGTLGTADYVPGKVGQAFGFSGTTEVAIPHHPSFSTPTFTVEAWVFPTAADGDVEVIVSKESSGFDTHFEVGIKGPLNNVLGTVPAGNLVYYIGGLAGMPDDYGGWINGGGAVPTNVWSHVALTLADGKVTTWINGIALRTVTIPGGSPRFNSGPLWIGSRSSHITSLYPLERFNGLIDELSLYNRGLSAAELSAIVQSGAAGKCGFTTPLKIVADPQPIETLSGETVEFSVGAAGAGPLTYQWSKDGNRIPNATNSVLLLTGIALSAAGNYSVEVCGLEGCLQSSAAKLTVIPGPSRFRLLGGTFPSGSSLAIPLEVLANGQENAISFSLSYNSAGLQFRSVTLSSNLVGASLTVNSEATAQGRLGVLIGLPPGTRLPEGTNSLVVLNFDTAVLGRDAFLQVNFTDNPIARQVLNPETLAVQANWQGTSVRLQGVEIEGDVSPRPVSDRLVNLSDFSQIGRFVAGLDALTPGSLFRRVDCAPRSSLGNGVISVSDWVQAARYAAQLDPLTAAGGPTNSPPIVPGNSGPTPRTDPIRVVTLDPLVLGLGESRELPVSINARGNESGMAFSLLFDPTQLRFEGAVLGADVGPGASWLVNSNAALAGRIGVALVLKTGSTLLPGQREVARIRFAALVVANSGSVALTDSPIAREVATQLAESLPVVWSPATVTVNPPHISASPASQGPQAGLNLSWTTSVGAVVETTSDLAQPNWQPVPVEIVVEGNTRTVFLPLGLSQGFYRVRF